MHSPSRMTLKFSRRSLRWNPAVTMHRNAFWTSYSIHKMIAGLPEADRDRLQSRAAAIAQKYNELSERYQSGKDKNSIPLN